MCWTSLTWTGRAGTGRQHMLDIAPELLVLLHGINCNPQVPMHGAQQRKESTGAISCVPWWCGKQPGHLPRLRAAGQWLTGEDGCVLVQGVGPGRRSKRPLCTHTQPCCQPLPGGHGRQRRQVHAGRCMGARHQREALPVAQDHRRGRHALSKVGCMLCDAVAADLHLLLAAVLGIAVAGCSRSCFLLPVGDGTTSVARLSFNMLPHVCLGLQDVRHCSSAL